MCKLNYGYIESHFHFPTKNISAVIFHMRYEKNTNNLLKPKSQKVRKKLKRSDWASFLRSPIQCVSNTIPWILTNFILLLFSIRMSLTVKAYLKRGENANPEIRRFTVDHDVTSSYEYLSKKVAQVFPSLGRPERFTLAWKGKIYWKDCEMWGTPQMV